MASAEETKIANKTSRNSPAIGAKAITPAYVRQYVKEHLDMDASILDYGAGKTAAHAQAMVEDGFQCLAWEFGNNVNPRYHCELALMNVYDVVYASNVLNVQSSMEMLRETIGDVKRVSNSNSVFIANFPADPRKMKYLTTGAMRAVLEEEFATVTQVGGTKRAPLWLMTN